MPRGRRLGPDAKDRRRSQLIRKKEAAKRAYQAAEAALDRSNRAPYPSVQPGMTKKGIANVHRRVKALNKGNAKLRLRFQKLYSKYAQAASALDRYERANF